MKHNMHKGARSSGFSKHLSQKNISDQLTQFIENSFAWEMKVQWKIDRHFSRGKDIRLG